MATVAGFVVLSVIGVIWAAELVRMRRTSWLVAGAVAGGAFLGTWLTTIAALSSDENIDSWYPQFIYLTYVVLLGAPLSLGAGIGLIRRTWAERGSRAPQP